MPVLSGYPLSYIGIVSDEYTKKEESIPTMGGQNKRKKKQDSFNFKKLY
jgi:hypothetical protein